MRFVIVIPGLQPDPLPCPLEGKGFAALVEALSFYTSAYDLAWIANAYPLYTITLVKKSD
ncbi:MAG: hypothetical protein KAR39_11815 [Thermoplasmata archaeon]|nr:hypothetical protein [Thermoplasmata archaeon]